MNNYGIVLFENSSSAMQAESVLQRVSLQVKLVPTPRQLSSNCGVALRFDWDQKQVVESWLAKGRVEVSGIFPLPDGKRKAVRAAAGF
jgi:hypothetical protein